ncbi:MAG: hypothetical protein NZ551_05975 [Microscillaceae bacterium]|nr:hypothetical protein [Microscillaceae bacterium]MDW8460741.1 triple tyrosine motif-containing protein [Cytophagales bacterium]
MLNNYQKFYIVIFLFFVVLDLFAQTGLFHTFHYNPAIENFDRRNTAVIQGTDGVMYFANQQGVLIYDGINWELVKTPATPQVLAIDYANDGRIYVGCKGYFGYLKSSEKGQKYYQNLIVNKEAYISNIAILDKTIYLLTNRAVWVFSTNTNKVERVIPSLSGEPLIGMFVFQKALYVSILGRGLHILKENNLVAVPEATQGTRQGVLLAIPYDEQLLLGNGENELFLFNGSNLKPFRTEFDKYLKEKILSGAAASQGNQVAIGTISGGVVFFHKQTQKVVNTLNVYSGLPDDEILALCADRQGSFWICHGYGISRVDAYLPIRNFSNYWGLEGNITTILKTEKTLYAGTNSGLFYLTQFTSMQEVAASIQKQFKMMQQKATSKIITRTIQTQQIESEPLPVDNKSPSKEKTEKKKSNFFRNIFESKKKRKEREERENIQKQQREKEKITQIEEKIIQEIQPETTTLLEENLSKIDNPLLLGTITAGSEKPFIYKRVEGIEARCKQIIAYKKYLLVATSVGLFAVNTETQTATKIIPNAYIHFIRQSATEENVFYIASNQMIASIIFENDTWQVVEKYTRINSEIYSLVEYDNILWAGADNHVFALAIAEKGTFSDYRKFTFEGDYAGTVTVRIVQQELLFFTLAGVYKFDTNKGTFQKQKTKLAQYYGERAKIYTNQPAHTWLKSERHWYDLNQLSQKDTLKTAFLNLFKNISDIYLDNEENLWVATEGAIYCVDRQAQLNYQKTFNIFVKSVSSQRGIYFSLQDLTIDKEEIQLEFKFQLATPFYLNENDIEYQYRVVGINTASQWSDWSKQSEIKLSFLSAGYYTLEVRARNVLGQVSEIQKIDFRIKPPFWETWWFYVLQILFLLGLLLGSILIRQSDKNARLANILTMLTVITVFEFIIVFLEPYTDRFTGGVPVFKVIMNIILAASLNPLEKFLHHYISTRKIQLKIYKIKHVEREQPSTIDIGDTK